MLLPYWSLIIVQLFLNHIREQEFQKVFSEIACFERIEAIIFVAYWNIYSRMKLEVLSCDLFSLFSRLASHKNLIILMDFSWPDVFSFSSQVMCLAFVAREHQPRAFFSVTGHPIVSGYDDSCEWPDSLACNLVSPWERQRTSPKPSAWFVGKCSPLLLPTFGDPRWASGWWWVRFWGPSSFCPRPRSCLWLGPRVRISSTSGDATFGTSTLSTRRSVARTTRSSLPKRLKSSVRRTDGGKRRFLLKWLWTQIA